jgi:hypothetical protein
MMQVNTHTHRNLDKSKLAGHVTLKTESPEQSQYLTMGTSPGYTLA